ncbi:MAG: tetratricopeptide repeat protein [Deltaproteobacteria bacterium]|nr:tetratricopeptide repeat protein [Deltaproteobacteria bacterium]
MNRVESAIQEGRCLLAIGSRALQETEVFLEVRRRIPLPVVTLGARALDVVPAVTPEAVAPLLAREGGLLVLVEPDAAADGSGLAALARLVGDGRNKPRLCIAARAFNPFTLPPALRMLKMDQERKRARDFLAALPLATQPVVPEPVVEPRAPVPESPTRIEADGPAEVGRKERAPRVGFAGRASEQAAFAGLLGEGGPIVVHGPLGIGRRWLVEAVLKGTPLRRVPDVELGWGAEADVLYARLAALTAEAGEPRLAHAVRTPEERPAPDALADLATSCLAAEALGNVVMVVHGAQRLLRDDGTFHRGGRLELLLAALLTRRYAPRIVFTFERVPVFHREGAAAAMRALEVGGLEPQDMHEIFDAYRHGDVPRDRMEAVHRQTRGHPMAVRLLAIAVRDDPDPEARILDHRLLHLKHVCDTEAITRHLRRRLESLSEPMRGALALASHLRMPADADLLQTLGVGRAERLALLGLGLLDFLPDEDNRRFRVHPLVAHLLPRREVADLKVLETLGEALLDAGRRAQGLERLALGQEANRCMMASRNPQRCVRVGWPDHDPIVESVRGILRAPNPYLQLAEARLQQVLRADPANTEAALLNAERLRVARAEPDAVREVFRQAAELAPTPEVFHAEAEWHLSHGKRGDLPAAIDALGRGCARFPSDGRLRRRLANCLVQAERRDEALTVLKEALALEPGMPDTYGLVGSILLDRGPTAWAEAAGFLEEALRLAPGDPLHLTRLARLERLRALLDPEAREALLVSAMARLEEAVKADRPHTPAFVEYARLLLDRPDPIDLDKVGGLLKQVASQRGAPDLQVLRARLAARSGRAGEAEAALEGLLRREPAHWEARAALAELLFHRGKVFAAHDACKRAQEAAPPHAPERIAYEGMLSMLRALIDSGAAIEMERRADEAVPSEPAQTAPVLRGPRETTRRRGRRSPRPEPDPVPPSPGEGKTPEPGPLPSDAPEPSPGDDNPTPTG